MVTLKHGDVDMKIVTLEAATFKHVKRRAQNAFKGRKQGARISFATPELLFQLIIARSSVNASGRSYAAPVKAEWLRHLLSSMLFPRSSGDVY